MSDFTSSIAKGTLGSGAGIINLVAANPGTWGNDITVGADQAGITAQVALLYKDYGLVQADLFNFYIYCDKKLVESFTCVTTKSIKNNPNRLDLTLEHESNLLLVPKDGLSGAGDYATALAKAIGALDKAITTLSNAVGDQAKAKAKALVKTAKNDPALVGNFNHGDDGAHFTESDHYLGDEASRTGIYALEKVDIFNMLCIPMDDADADSTDETCKAVNPVAAEFCEKYRALFIAEPLKAWREDAHHGNWSSIQPTDLAINGDTGRYATTYFPRVKIPDPQMKDRERVFSACGLITGAMATNDLNFGVWKAPAGQDAGLAGVTGLEVKVNDQDNGFLNPIGINCLRDFPIIGPVIWGDRTLRGADLLSDDYKYVSVRRLTNYIENSLMRGTKWAVFEDNDESLWSQLRLSIGAFLKELSVLGAFYNYSVKCDASTTTADDIAKGIVNVEVHFAPVKPAEFVVLKFQQTAATSTS